MDKKPISPEQLKRPLPECESEKKETPEKMIHSLQSIFCKGRYSSWVSAKEFLSSKNLRYEKKHRKSVAKNR